MKYIWLVETRMNSHGEHISPFTLVAVLNTAWAYICESPSILLLDPQEAVTGSP